MQQFIVDPWDMYKDLNLILADPECKENGISAANALIINPVPCEVQQCLGNSICPVDYRDEDVAEKPRMHEGEWQTLDANWHAEHMGQLTDYVLELLDKADNVPDYLAAHKSRFTAPDLLGK